MALISSIVIDFSVPLPYRDYNVFDIGKTEFLPETEDTYGNYINSHLSPYLEFIRKNRITVGAYFTGDFMTQLKKNENVFRKIKNAIQEGFLIPVGGTWANSVSFLYSMEIFEFEVNKHANLTEATFGYRPTVFLNTGNIYSNGLAKTLEKIGFSATIADPVEWYLNNRNPFQLFKAFDSNLFILMGNLQSRQIPKGISGSRVLLIQASVAEKTLTGKKSPILKEKVSSIDELIKGENVIELFNAPISIGGSTIPGGINSVNSLPLQKKAIEKWLSLYEMVKNSKNNDIVEIWLNLGDFKHLLRMNATGSDVDIHPYDVFMSYVNRLTDMKLRLL